MSQQVETDMVDISSGIKNMTLGKSNTGTATPSNGMSALGRMRLQQQ